VIRLTILPCSSDIVLDAATLGTAFLILEVVGGLLGAFRLLGALDGVLKKPLFILDL